MIKVLVVDDSALVRKLLSQAFTQQGDFEVLLARDGETALTQIAAFQPDVVTLDIQMPGMDGLACLDRIMLERPCPVVVVAAAVTAAGADAALEALRLGAVDFVAKPTGAVSLHLDEWAPALIAKVRMAAGSKPRLSVRLRERVRHRMRRPALPAAAGAAPQRSAARLSGDGLVLVGTSTGGPPALEALLTALPASFPWPIVVAQHMPGSFTGPLARRLDSLCALTVSEVRDPALLQPGGVYIGRGDADIILSRRGGSLIAMAAPGRPDYPWRPSVDRLVRSAMELLPASQLMAILLTGMGSDGAEAMADLHRGGGRTIAEAEETAVVWGMPGELVRAGGADWILPLQEIAAGLLKLVPSAANPQG